MKELLKLVRQLDLAIQVKTKEQSMLIATIVDKIKELTNETTFTP